MSQAHLDPTPAEASHVNDESADVDALAQEADRFEDQRAALAAKLEEQLEVAVARISEWQRRARVLQDALARVRGGRRVIGGREAPPVSGVLGGEGADELDLSGAKTSEAIWFAIAAHPKGITADGIRQWVGKRGKALGTKAMHTYLHRMLADGRLISQGDRGSRHYFLGEAKEGVMPSG